MANGYTKRCSTALAFRDMQIKTAMTSHLLEWLLSTKEAITSVGEVMEKKIYSFSAGGKVKWYSNFGKECGGSSKNYE